MSKNIKGISTLIGGLCVHLMIGSSYAWGNIYPYLISHFYENDDEIVISDGYFLMPIAIFFSTCFFTLGGFLENKFGPRIVILGGTIFMVLGYFLIYLAKSLSLIYVGLGLAGVGIGIAYSPPLRTSWKYFPKNKGLITGLIVFGFGCSALLLNQIVTWYVNPDYQNKTVVGPKDTYYSPEVADRIQGFFLILVGLFAGLGTLGAILTIPYIDTETEKEPLVQAYNILNPDRERTNLTEKEKESVANPHETFKNALSNKDFWFCYIMGVCTLFYPFMVTNINKNFGSLKHHKEEYLSTLVKIYPIINGSSRIFTGPLIDYVDFKYLYATLNVFVIILSSTIYLIAENDFLYFAYNIMTAICLGANFAIFPPFISKKYGLKNASEVYGVVFFGFGVASLLGPIVAKFVIHDLSDYLMIFIIGAVLAGLSLILTIILDTKPYDYNKHAEVNL